MSRRILCQESANKMNRSAQRVALLLALVAAARSPQAQEISLPNLRFLDRVTYGATVRDVEALRTLGRDGYLDRELVFRGDDGLSAEARSFIDALPVSRTRSGDLAAQLREARRSVWGTSDDQKREMVKTLRKDFAQLDFQACARLSLRADVRPWRHGARARAARREDGRLRIHLSIAARVACVMIQHNIDGINRSPAVLPLPPAAGRLGPVASPRQKAHYLHFLTIALRATANAPDRHRV
jgi:hypothetical protein